MEKNAEQNLQQVKANVQQKFNELRAALHMREKLLLRQLEAIANTQQQQQMLKTSRSDEHSGPGTSSWEESGEVRFVTSEEEELLSSIRSFGRFQLDNIQLQALQDVFLRNEDYIAPVDDHDTMYKCLQDGKIAYYDLDEEEQPEAIVVDFSRNKSLVEDNAKLMNKSIINITLQEAKELIRKAKTKRETHVPPLNLEELNDELESSIADAVSSLGRSGDASKSTCVEQPNSSKPKSRKPRFKPKITINNCNGTINLRNIASLTINCANEEAVSAEIPLTQSKLEQSADSSTTDHSTPTTTASSSNYSSNASSRSQSKKQKSNNNNSSIGKKDYQKGAVATSSTSVESTPTNTQPTSTNSYSNRYEEDVEVSETETHDVTCDFYNRLLNEIKKSLKEKPIRSYDNAPVATTNLTTTNASNKATTNSVQAAAADSTCDANSNSMRRSNDGSAPHTNKTHTNVTNSTLSSNIQPGKRLVLKNFENLKIILEANSGDEDTFHPVQIEQWLAEIISETDLEPMQNTDILEHSKINNSETN